MRLDLLTAIATLYLSTALTPVDAGPVSIGGRGVSVSVGGLSAGTGGVSSGGVGGISGGGIGGLGAGSIGGGSLGGLVGGGVTVGPGGRILGINLGKGGSGPHFTGSNFFSGGANFGNDTAGRVTRGSQAFGQRVTGDVNKAANVKSSRLGKSLNCKSDAIAAHTGKASKNAQAAARRAAPALARTRTINVGGPNGVTVIATPIAPTGNTAPAANVNIGNRAAPVANIDARHGDGATKPLLSTNTTVLDQPGAKVGDSNPGGGIASNNVSALNAGGHQHRQHVER